MGAKNSPQAKLPPQPKKSPLCMRQGQPEVPQRVVAVCGKHSCGRKTRDGYRQTCTTGSNFATLV